MQNKPREACFHWVGTLVYIENYLKRQGAIFTIKTQ